MDDNNVMDQEQQSPIRGFDYGDLTVECGACGNKDIISKLVKGGIQITLPTNNHHDIRLVCSKCSNSMKLYWQESSAEDVAEYEKQLEQNETQVPDENESVQEDNKEEVSV